MEKIPYSRFKHGQRVACKIEGTQIDDAKISINKDGAIFICQNKRIGVRADDKLGYASSWVIFNSDRSPVHGLEREVAGLIFLDRSIEDVQEGDVIDCKGAREAKILGKCGEVIFLSKTNCHSLYGQALTIEQLKEAGCIIKQDTPPTITEVTLQEVADKMGVPVEQLRIKE